MKKILTRCFRPVVLGLLLVMGGVAASAQEGGLVRMNRFGVSGGLVMPTDDSEDLQAYTLSAFYQRQLNYWLDLKVEFQYTGFDGSVQPYRGMDVFSLPVLLLWHKNWFHAGLGAAESYYIAYDKFDHYEWAPSLLMDVTATYKCVGIGMRETWDILYESFNTSIYLFLIF